MLCPRCGEDIKKQSAVCGNCGAPAPGSVAALGWTAHKVIDFFTDSKNGLGLPAVCDDGDAIKQAVETRRAVKLKDEKSTTSSVAYAAKEWFKNADHILRRRLELLQLVYEMFVALADVAVNSSGDGNGGLYTPRLGQSFLVLARNHCKTDDSLSRRFITHYRRGRYGHLQVSVNAPGVEVTVNGWSLGAADPGKPVTCEILAVGEATVRVSGDGYETQSKAVKVTRNETTMVAFELKPARPKAAPEPSEFDVILKEIGQDKIRVIKEVRAITGLGLKEAKDLVDGAPKPVKRSVNYEEAKAIKEKLEAVGAVIELKSEAPEAPVDKGLTEFDVILKEIGQNKIRVIKEVRAITGLGLKEAVDLVDGAPKPVKEGVDDEEAKAIKEKLEAVGAVIELKGK